MKRYLMLGVAGVAIAAGAGMLLLRAPAPASQPVKYAKPLPPAVTRHQSGAC